MSAPYTYSCNLLFFLLCCQFLPLPTGSVYKHGTILFSQKRISFDPTFVSNYHYSFLFPFIAKLSVELSTLIVSKSPPGIFSYFIQWDFHTHIHFLHWDCFYQGHKWLLGCQIHWLILNPHIIWPIKSFDIDDYFLLSDTHFSLGFQRNILFCVFSSWMTMFVFFLELFSSPWCLSFEMPKDVPGPLNSPFIYLNSLP